ncbi:MAG: DUF2171 domain-containing protein [Gaiellaceae bacterium]
MADPVSWLQIAQGWSVVSSDGAAVGTVAQVAGDKEMDIFDGLAIEPAQAAELRYVTGDQVAAVHPGEVTLKITAAEAAALEPFQAQPPETKWVPGKPPLTKRLSNWLRGKS